MGYKAKATAGAVVIIVWIEVYTFAIIYQTF